MPTLENVHRRIMTTLDRAVFIMWEISSLGPNKIRSLLIRSYRKPTLHLWDQIPADDHGGDP